MTEDDQVAATTLAEPSRRSDELKELRLEVRRFLAEELAAGRWEPQVDSWQSGINPEFSLRLAERGWVGMTVPTRYGGHGRSELERFTVNEELLAAGAPVAAHWIADRQMAPSILRNGTEEQRHRYLPGIARAKRLFAIGMSEPDSGSDLASVRTRAYQIDDGWRLMGTKLWTSGAHIATNIVALARTDESSDRHAGLSQFIIDLPHPDVHVNPIITIDGRHHFNEVVFDEAVLPMSALLGRRGDGWKQVTQELANERSGPERILSTMPLLREWAGLPQIYSDPAARLELARLVSRLTALRQMSLAVAQLLRDGANPAIEAAMVKDLGTSFESEIVEVIRRFMELEIDPSGEGITRMLADAILHTPAFTLRGGTNEVLRSIVAKSLKP